MVPGPALAGLLLAACGTPAGDPGVAATGPASAVQSSNTVQSSIPAGSAVPGDGDPNAAGRALATATPSTVPARGEAAGGSAAGICANETLADSLRRAVEAGASVVLATGRFTGTIRSADGEIAVPYSEIALTDASTLAGPQLPAAGSAWVYGDLAAAGQASATGETSSLWARGGRLVAVIDPASDGSGLPGPVIRVAPVVGDDVIMGWVGCWSTQGVPSRDFDGGIELFDDRGLHPTDMALSAVTLDDFRSALPSG